MPLILTDNINSQTTIAVWHITEDLGFFLSHLKLAPADEEFLASVHPRRALEWAASRMLVRRTTNTPISEICINDSSGKPYLPGDPDRQISISHSAGSVAIAVSALPIGIDLQIETAKLARIAPKFISDEEWTLIGESNRLAHIHLCWSSKEAMFKLYSKGQVDFRKHLRVELPQTIGASGIFAGTISKDDFTTQCTLHYRYIDNYLLVYALIDELA